MWITMRVDITHPPVNRPRWLIQYTRPVTGVNMAARALLNPRIPASLQNGIFVTYLEVQPDRNVKIRLCKLAHITRFSIQPVRVASANNQRSNRYIVSADRFGD